MSDNGITFFLPSILLVDVIDDWNGCESGGGRTLYTLYHRCIAMECRTDAQFEFYMHNNLVNTGYAKKNLHGVCVCGSRKPTDRLLKKNIRYIHNLFSTHC